MILLKARSLFNFPWSVTVWADSAYRSGAIEEVLALLDFESLNWQLNDEGQGILVPLGFSLPLQLE